MTGGHFGADSVRAVDVLGRMSERRDKDDVLYWPIPIHASPYSHVPRHGVSFPSQHALVMYRRP
jgi:hypothetical protein